MFINLMYPSILIIKYRKIFFNVIEYSRIGRNHSLGSAVLSLNGLNNEAKLEKRLILQDSVFY